MQGVVRQKRQISAVEGLKPCRVLLGYVAMHLRLSDLPKRPRGVRILAVKLQQKQGDLITKWISSNSRDITRVIKLLTTNGI